MSKNKSEYKIIFDTNILFCDEINELDKVVNSNIREVNEFIKSHKIKGVSLWIPQMVIDERVAQRLEQIKKEYNRFNLALRNLESIDNTNKTKIFLENKFRKLLNDKFNETLDKYKIKIIPTVKIDQEILIKRSLEKKPPFANNPNKKGDNGFKDTLIWLSILKDVQDDPGSNYILLTDNSNDFNEDVCKEEFGEYSKRDFQIFSDLNGLKEFFDKELNLRLELKKLNRDIKQEILCLQGTITAKVGSFLNKDDIYGSVFRHIKNYKDIIEEPVSYISASNVDITRCAVSDVFNCSVADSGISAYDRRPSDRLNFTGKGNFDFYDLDVSDIRRKSKNVFEISAMLYIVRDKEEYIQGRVSTVRAYPISYGNSREICLYHIEFIYYRKKKDILVVSAR